MLLRKEETLKMENGRILRGERKETYFRTLSWRRENTFPSSSSFLDPISDHAPRRKKRRESEAHDSPEKERGGDENVDGGDIIHDCRDRRRRHDKSALSQTGEAGVLLCRQK